MTRDEEKAEFTYKLGLLLSPIVDVIKNSGDYDQSERQRIRARYRADHVQLHNELAAFCQGEAGARYDDEWNEIAHAMGSLHNVATSIVPMPLPPRILESLDSQRANVLKAIAGIPTRSSSSILEANTPFSSYRRLKTLCEGASKQVVCVDRYLDETIFDRQLANIPAHVEVTLVTWRKALTTPFLDISRLYAAERGTKYRLMTERRIHDRWLRCDDRLFLLGGSVNHAGTSAVYTVAPMSGSPAELAKVDQLIAGAKEIFGPSAPAHP